jgi:hypothetical protein
VAADALSRVETIAAPVTHDALAAAQKVTQNCSRSW